MTYRVDKESSRQSVSKFNNKTKPKLQPTAQVDNLTSANRSSARVKKNEAQAYADQRREHLEKLLGGALAGRASFINFYKNNAFQQANTAYNAAVSNPSLPFTAATSQGLTDYQNTLNRFGVSPLESQNPNLLTSIRFLNAEAARSGNLMTLDANALRNLAQNSEMPQVYARMLWTGGGALDKPDARLSFFDSSNNRGKSIAWATRVEDLAGSRLDYQEVMRRIGWTAADIATADPANFKLVLFTADAAVMPTIPTAENIIDLARRDVSVFGGSAAKPDSFWQEVVSYDYETRSNEARAGGFDRTNINKFIQTLPTAEAEIFEARFKLEDRMGVNPLFTGDGTTQRPDLLNESVGVREYVVNNTTDDATLRRMAQNGQVALIDLHDIGSLDAFKANLATNPNASLPDVPVAITDTPAALPTFSERAAMRNEIRSGAVMGGAFSAVTSLPQVFDRVSTGDYQAAAATLAVNTSVGTSSGGLSAAADRFFAQRFESSLANSNLAQNGFNRLYSNTAARNFVGRFAQTEASNLTSSAFNATARQLGSRVLSGGMVGGIVNGTFSAIDQYGAYNRGEVTASQAIGTVAGEAAVGVGAGLAGAAAGAAIGSIVPGLGTVVGGIVGFGVGMAASYLADQGLRGLGVDKMIAQGVTKTIDTVSNIAQNVGNAVSETANNIADGAKNLLSGAGNTLASIFG